MRNQINDNGIEKGYACSIKNMVTGTTLFADREIHKMAWRSLDGNTFNQTDHPFHGCLLKVSTS